MGTRPDPVTVFESERRRLFGIAYRMLGVVADAEDVVQEAWIRLQGVDHDIERPEAFLTTVTTRLAIDRLRSAQRNRETYVGPWLPEPVLTDLDPARIVELDESVTLGFLHVLDRLAPVERAVFLLHDVFDTGYGDIAAMIDRTPAATRQIAKRARDRVHNGRCRTDPDPGPSGELLAALMTAVAGGDEAEVRRLLADDVVLTSDGGAERPAARRPVVGADRVARFMVNLAARLGDAAAVPAEVNGAPGVVIVIDGRPDTVVDISVSGGQVTALHFVRNPHKLRAVSEVWPA